MTNVSCSGRVRAENWQFDWFLVARKLEGISNSLNDKEKLLALLDHLKESVFLEQ